MDIKCECGQVTTLIEKDGKMYYGDRHGTGPDCQYKGCFNCHRDILKIVEDSPVDTEPDYDSMSLSELKKAAKNLNVKFGANATKAALLLKIKEIKE